MSGDETFSSRDQLPAQAQATAPKVGITFEGEFIAIIDRLVDALAATTRGGDDAQRRRLAIATAVSTLSDYAGEPLFVRRQGRLLEIEGLWR
jgi:hypothetical protein